MLESLPMPSLSDELENLLREYLVLRSERAAAYQEIKQLERRAESKEIRMEEYRRKLKKFVATDSDKVRRFALVGSILIEIVGNDSKQAEVNVHAVEGSGRPLRGKP